MAKAEGNTDYVKAFIRRVYSARGAADLTQEEIALLLGTTQPTYSKYETRSLLPHYHTRAFCLACKITAEWLMWGQGKGVPLLAKAPPKSRPGRRARKTAAAA